MNVTLANASAQVRPFVWGDPNVGLNYTTVALPSNGKFKETIYTSFQALLTDTVAGATATIQIQGTHDALTGAGILIPVLLTNGSANVVVPTGPYTVNVLDGNGQPTGQRTVQTPPYQSFYAVPPMDAWCVPGPTNVARGIPEGGGYGSYGGTQQNVFSLSTGMTIGSGTPGFVVGTVINSFTNATTLVASNSWTGTTGNYYINFTNNYWASTPVATISLTAAGVLFATDGVTTVSNWRWIRANVTAITGTLPQLMVFMGA